MPRHRIKSCDHCQAVAPLLYRAQYEPSGRWYFLCPNCWEALAPNNPYYTYGGTWKAVK